MGIRDKFDMLEAIGGIDEKYIKKADRLIEERAEIDRQVIKLAPEKRKFSWKSAAAAAACAAVVVVGTAAAVKLAGRSDPIVNPNNGYTLEQQEYIDDWKEKLGASVNVAYAVDRLNFIEIKLPEDVTGRYFTDENTAVYIEEDKEYGYANLVTYDIKIKEYHTEVQLASNMTWRICFADQNYVLYHGYSNRDNGYQTGDELYLYDYNTHQNYLLYVEETETDDIDPWSNSMIAADGKVYFTVYGEDSKCSVHVYDIEAKRELWPIENANSPRYYKGDILYNDVSGDDLYVRSISGKYNFEGSVIVTDYGLYKLTSGGGLTELESGREIIPADSSRTGILNLDDYCDFALQFGGISLNSAWASENALRFIYYAPTDEILVFEDGDGFTELTCFGWGAYITKTEPDGTVREFIIIDKVSDNSIKIPKLDRDAKLENTSSDTEQLPEKVDPRQQYLDDIRDQLNVSDSVGVAYARDRLNITHFSLPWETVFAIDSGTLFIDSNHALVSDIHLLDKIEMYTLDTKEYVTLLSAETDPLANENTLYQIYYADSEYIVFSRTDFDSQHDLCLIELKKEGYPCTTIGINNVGFLEHLFINENTIYFASWNGDKPMVSRYDIGRDEEPSSWLEGVPLCVYNGELLYYTMQEGVPYRAGVDTDETDYNKRIIHSTNGKLAIEGQPYTENMWACRYGVFGLDGGEFKNCLTGQVIFSADYDLSLFKSLQPDFGVVFGHGFVNYIYNANTKELLVFDEADDIDSLAWKSCKWGVCSMDGILISQFENARPMNKRDRSYSEYGIPNVLIPTNDDPKYPFNIWLDIDRDSISIVQSDDLPYGFTEYLDEDKLRFTMNIALKENYYKYSECSVEVAGYGVTLKRGETAQVKGLSIGEYGQSGITLWNSTEELDYGSVIHSVVELDDTIVVEIFFGVAYEGGRLV